MITNNIKKNSRWVIVNIKGAVEELDVVVVSVVLILEVVTVKEELTREVKKLVEVEGLWEGGKSDWLTIPKVYSTG